MNMNQQLEVLRNSKARFIMELNEATASLNADREEMAEKEEEREKLEAEYKLYMSKCKKRIEWIFFQDFCAYLVIRAQVMTYSKESLQRRSSTATSPRMSPVSAQCLATTSVPTRGARMDA